MNEKLKKLMLDILQTEKIIKQMEADKPLIAIPEEDSKLTISKWDDVDGLLLDDLIEKIHSKTLELKKLLNEIY